MVLLIGMYHEKWKYMFTQRMCCCILSSILSNDWQFETTQMSLTFKWIRKCGLSKPQHSVQWWKGKNWCTQWHKRISGILLMQGTKDTICSYLFFHHNLLFSFQNCFSKSDKSNPSRFSLGLTSKVLFFFLEDINHTDFLRLFSLNSISLNSGNVTE